MRNWLFWDQADLADKTPAQLEEYILALRSAQARDEIRRLARRFIERARGADTVRLFTREEIRAALEDIERSKLSLRFVDPIRIRMYRRYLGPGV